MRQPITEFWEDEPAPATIIAEGVASPLGGPDPIPLDAPFGANVQVENAAGAQRTISIAAGTGQDFYVAYEHPGAPTDVRVAKSTNLGASWTILSLPAVTYNRRSPDVIFVAPSTVIVYIEHDDATAATTFRYLVSTNAGSTWATHTLSMGTFGFANLKLPGGSVCQTPGGCMNSDGVATPVIIMVGYEGDCTRTDCAPAPGAKQTVFFSDGTPGTAQNWWIEIYSSGDTLNEGFRPQFAGSGVMQHLLVEFEMVNNAAWDVYLFRIDQVNGTLDAVAICGTTCPSNDPIYGSVAALGRNVVFGGAYRNPVFFGTPNHLMNVLNSSVDGGGVANWNFIQGGNGFFENPSMEQKYLNLGGVGDVFHATYRSATDVVYWMSADGSNWAGPYRASSNGPPGTVVDVHHSVAVAYGAKVGIAFLDSRDGDDDPWFATLSGASMYIVKKNPTFLGGTINIDGLDVPVPAAYIWNVGSLHPVNAPAMEPGPPNTQYLWQSWSDGGANPHDVNVGAADTVVTANYLTQYWLTMSSTVGGVTLTPGSSWQNGGASVTIECRMPPPSTYVRYTFGGWIGSGPGAYTGMANPTPIAMNGPITEVCDATREFLWTLATQPSGLDMNIDGTPLVTPQQPWWGDGSSHAITAISPQQPLGPTQRYVFDRWLEDGTRVLTKTFNPVTGAANWTAVYSTEYQITISSTPSACQYTVDGMTYTGSQVFWFVRDTTHVVDMPSPQAAGPDTRYVFGSWSDGGARNHAVLVNVAGMTLDLTCTVENRFVIDTAPSGTLTFTVDGGAPITGPQTYWWPAGQSHAVNFPTPQSVGAGSQRVFAQWSDASTANPRTFVSGTTTPGSYTIQTYLEHRYTFATSPAGLVITINVGGTNVVTPGQIWLRDGVAVTITAPDPAAGPAGTRYVWVSWSDTGAVSHQVTPTGPVDLIVTYRTQYYLTVTTPYGTGSCSVASCWYDAGQSATAILSTDLVPGGPGTRYAFNQWTGAATGAVFSGSNPITMDAPKTATADWKTQYQLTVTTPYGTGSCSVASCWYDAGTTTATASVTPTIVAGPTDTRYAFAQWSGDASGTAGTSNPITMDAPKTATAQWKTQYYVTVVVGQAGITATCSNADCWFDDGASATVALDSPGIETTPGTRIGFIRWTGAGTGTNYQQSNAIFMNGPKTVTVDWQTQYKLTLVGDDPAGSGTSAVTQPGSTDGWYVADATATLQVTQYAEAASGDVRWEFQSWTGATGTGLSGSVVMSGPKSVTVNWQRQVKITFTTSPILSGVQATVDGAPIGGNTWVNDGEQVDIVAPATVQSGGKTYEFLGWTGITGSATTTASFTEPTGLVARYQEASSPIGLIAAIIGIIVAAILVALFLLMRKRKKEEPAPPAAAPARAAPAPAAAAGGTMECPSCGLTIEAGSSACPICGASIAPPPPAAKDERVRKLEEAYQSGRITKEQYQANLKRMRGQ